MVGQALKIDRYQWRKHKLPVGRGVRRLRPTVDPLVAPSIPFTPNRTFDYYAIITNIFIVDNVYLKHQNVENLLIVRNIESQHFKPLNICSSAFSDNKLLKLN